MIVAKNKNALSYLGINPNLDAALRRLAEGIDDVEPGHYDMDGDNVYLNCFDYETVPEETSTYEAHERYGDIHIVLKGREKMGVSHPSTLQVLQRQPENDYIELTGADEHLLIMEPGSFLVVFPEDAHRIKMQVNGSEAVRKAVFKFKI